MGVLLIVVGHMLYGSDDFAVINKIIYSFHVPLFFVLSGYVYKKHENEKIGSFIINKLFRMFEKTFEPHMDIVLCISAFVIGSTICSFKIFLPFGLNRTIIAMGFFYAGRIAKQKSITFVYTKSCIFCLCDFMRNMCYLI